MSETSSGGGGGGGGGGRGSSRRRGGGRGRGGGGGGGGSSRRGGGGGSGRGGDGDGASSAPSTPRSGRGRGGGSSAEGGGDGGDGRGGSSRRSGGRRGGRGRSRRGRGGAIGDGDAAAADEYASSNGVEGRGGGRGDGGGSQRGGLGGGGGGRSRPPNKGFDRMGDEEVLIAFMPFIRGEDNAAKAIHAKHGADQRAFVAAARQFLTARSDDAPPAPPQPSSSSPPKQQRKEEAGWERSTVGHVAAPAGGGSGEKPGSAEQPPALARKIEALTVEELESGVVASANTGPFPPAEAAPPPQAAAVTAGATLASTPSVATAAPPLASVSQPAPANVASAPPPQMGAPGLPPPGLQQQPRPQHQVQPPLPPASAALGASAPAPPPGMLHPQMQQYQQQLPPSAQMQPPAGPTGQPLRAAPPPSLVTHHLYQRPVATAALGGGPPPGLPPGLASPLRPAPRASHLTPAPPGLPGAANAAFSQAPPPGMPGFVANGPSPSSPDNITAEMRAIVDGVVDVIADDMDDHDGEGGKTGVEAAAAPQPKEQPQQQQPPVPPPAPPKHVWTPKRTLTRLHTQPGKILTNGIAASPDGRAELSLGPRRELVARWMLPLAFLRERMLRKLHEEGGEEAVAAAGSDITIRDAIRSLSVGLFRRGCAENGASHSIISKMIVPPDPADVAKAAAKAAASAGPGREGGGGNHHHQQQQQQHVQTKEYPFEIDSRAGCLWGDVPFYTPRTPGTVVARLYFEDAPLATLASGPTVRVRIAGNDVEPTLRFILSNFKSKKGTANFSSLHSLSNVLEQFAPHPGGGGQQGGGRGGRGSYRNQGRGGGGGDDRSLYDGACRAAWGCMAESRKVVDHAYAEHVKVKEKVERQEGELQDKIAELEELVEEGGDGEGDVPDVKAKAKPEKAVMGVKGDSNHDDDADAALTPRQSLDKAHERLGRVHSERSSNDKRWREMQVAFAGVIRSTIFNPHAHLIVKRDVLTKLRCEYELWCPLSEKFAPSPFSAAQAQGGGGKTTERHPPGNNNNNNNNRGGGKDTGGGGGVNGGEENTGAAVRFPSNARFPHHVEPHHFKMCREARASMQRDLLGFAPNYADLHEAMGAPRRGSSPPTAGRVAKDLSKAMEDLYGEEYEIGAELQRVREGARAELDRVVMSCDGTVVPRGTRVVVFGSCANGFGSPKSDLDMCLQLPPSTSLADGEDKTGAAAMAKIAEKLIDAGMKNVDTVRLTARIPVVMFEYPLTKDPDSNNIAAIEANGVDHGDGETAKNKNVLECDLSMQNPLACLNTSLLLSYAQISPQTRVVASIIKRWAKARNINDPSHHTLSSYGYILMLLHFLTSHTADTPDGRIVPLHDSAGKRGGPPQQRGGGHPVPLLPNLQWMDQVWPSSPQGSAYREMPDKPRHQYCMMPHPTEPDFVVNTYFFRVPDREALAKLQARFSHSPSPVATAAANDPRRGAQPGGRKQQQAHHHPSTAELLAAFFKYYAYDFDYRRRVVSLNSTASRGHVEKETKAELDGWSLYRQVLSVEDPFETFYDVSHPVKAHTFQRLRREFALAYTKIADVATTRGGSGGDSSNSWGRDDLAKISGRELIDLICEPFVEDE